MERHRYPGLLALGFGAALVFLPGESWAIPAFARMYGMECSACHSAYPELNDAGESFRLSGFRRYNGVELTPKEPPIKIGPGLELPGTIPFSLSTTVGFNHNKITNTLGDGSKNEGSDEFRRRQDSFNLEDIKLLAGTPLGKHLSFFLDAPLGDTEFRQFFDPEIRENGTNSKTEGPEIPYLAFIGFHDILMPDLFNVKGGIFEVPTAFSPFIHRLSFFPYLAYEATALDVIGRSGFDDFAQVPGKGEEELEESQFRLSQPQIGAQVFGRASPNLLQIANLYVDYTAGVVNGDNRNADDNTDKDPVGRLSFTYRLPTATFAVGGFGYYSKNSLDSRTQNPDTMQGYRDKLWRYGPDARFTLTAPVYVNVFSQVLWGRDDNATGFGVRAKWWGGFVQGEVKPRDDVIVYGRYDWIQGSPFDDTGATINGESGETGPVDPHLWDAVGGAQYFLYDNFKLIAEFRHGSKNLGAVPIDEEQLRRTKENAVFTGVRLVF